MRFKFGKGGNENLVINSMYGTSCIYKHMALSQPFNNITPGRMLLETSYVFCNCLYFNLQQCVNLIDNWPSKSLNLNLIEHLWDNLDQRICRCANPPTYINKYVLPCLRSGITSLKLRSTNLCFLCKDNAIQLPEA